MKNGDMEARDKLIEHNLRLVAHIVKKYFAFIVFFYCVLCKEEIYGVEIFRKQA